MRRTVGVLVFGGCMYGASDSWEGAITRAVVVLLESCLTSPWTICSDPGAKRLAQLQVFSHVDSNKCAVCGVAAICCERLYRHMRIPGMLIEDHGMYRLAK